MSKFTFYYVLIMTYTTQLVAIWPVELGFSTTSIAGVSETTSVVSETISDFYSRHI